MAVQRNRRIGDSKLMVTTSIEPVAQRDEELIRASVHRPDAFGVIFDRHFTAVLRYLVRRVGSDRGAELASETFTRAFAGRGRYVAATPDARPWLLGIATNLIRGAHRAETRRLRAYSRLAPDQAGREDPDPAARLDAKAQAIPAAAAIRALPTRQRDVLLLHAWADLTPEQIATALGVPAGTVRSDLSRARARVSRAIDDHRPEQT